MKKQQKICCNFLSIFLFFTVRKMSYYQFRSKDIFQKAKRNYSKEKAAEYYLLNKEAIKKKKENRYKNMTDREKQTTKEYQKNYYKKLKAYKDELLLEKAKKM